MKGNPLILCMSIDMWWLPWYIFGVKYFKQGVGMIIFGVIFLIHLIRSLKNSKYLLNLAWLNVLKV